MAKITIVTLFLAMAAIRNRPFHQLDIKNVLLHDDLEKEVYMKQPPRFDAQGEFGPVYKLC